MKLSFFASALAIVALISCSSNNAKTDPNEVVADTISEGNTTVVLDSVAPDSASVTADVVKELNNDSKAEPQGRPLVIDFSATWCAPCQQFKPIFHKVAAEYASKADFASADVDICTTMAQKYNIQSIPFLLILNPDGSSASQMGSMPEAEFKAFLDKNLK